MLNSRLINWYFKLFSTNSNVNGYEIDNIPITVPDVASRDKLGRLASQILASKQRDPDANTASYECEIDRLVYGLYGLTGAEIIIVESAT